MALIFLMTGPATNAATIATVWKVQGKRVAIIYLCAVILTALGSGFLVNQFYYSVPESLQYHAHNMMSLRNQVITVILLLILIYGFIRNRCLGAKKMLSSDSKEKEILTFSVQGMHCSHCASSVQNAIASLENVEEVQVNLAKGVVEVKGHNLSKINIQNAVQGLGFTCSMKEKEVLTFSVQGMHCSHCANSVQNAIASLENVEEVQVNLAQGSVEVKGHNLSNTDIQNAIQALGFTCSIKEGDDK